MKFLFLLLLAATLCSAESLTEKDIPYYDETTLQRADHYQQTRCKLDVRHPAGASGLPTLIWFHGGGLTAGSREFPALPDADLILVSVSYRFSPPGPFPCSLEDAAAATAWAFRNISQYGGDPNRIFVGGHSAGGYLALMVGMDPRWLAPYQISRESIAGLIPVSAQVTTHFHVKKLRGDTGESLRPLIDEFAPLYHSSKDLPPILLITGDRRIEFKSRVEENEFFAITLKNLGHPEIEFHELPDLDHSTVNQGSMPLLPPFIQRISEAR